MKTNLKRVLTFALCSVMTLSLSAFALEYDYEGEQPGATFYQTTSLDEDYISQSDNIVVGADGTIATDYVGNPSSGPLSSIQMPVGEYPDAWGSTVDVAIAQTSVFPNELGPTTQTSAIYTPVYVGGAVSSGALPTGYGTVAVPAGGTMIAVPGAYGMWTPAGADVVGAPAYIAGAGNYFGVSVAASALPKLTKGGAIAKLSIPSVGMTKYVYDGTTSNNMYRGIAHFDCTPGWGEGNIALAGHNRGNNCAHFYHLKDVKIGDTVTYETALGTHTYVVSYIDTVATTDTSGLLQDGTSKLTMYTCKAGQPDVKLRVVATLVG